MYVGTLTLDILLGDVRSLKQKRSVVRPLIAEVRRRFPLVAVAETGHLDLHRRTEIGVAVVSATAANCGEVLAACERVVACHPEIEMLSARQRLFNEDEDQGRPVGSDAAPGPLSECKASKEGERDRGRSTRP